MKKKLTIKEEQGIKYIEDNETTSYFSKKLCNSSTSMKKDKPECSCNPAENEELKKLGLTDEDIKYIMNLLSPAAIISSDDVKEPITQSATSCPFNPKSTATATATAKAKGGSKKKRTIKNKKSKQKNRKSKQKNRKSKKNKKSKKIKEKNTKESQKNII